MSAHLAGKTVAFTGEFAGMTRAQVTRVAQAAGAQVTNTIGPKTDFLVCGKGPGEKAATANAMGVTMLSQPQFSRFVKNVDVNAVAAPQQPVMQYQQPAAQQQFQYPAGFQTKATRGRRPSAPAMAMPQQYQQYQAPAPVMQQPVMQQPKMSNKAVTLPGKSLTFTGSLETATRAEAGAMANQAGATVTATVTPSTDYLVCGAAPGHTKVAAAQAAGVSNITEAQFMKAASPAVNAMPEAPVYQAPAPVMQQYQQYQAPAPVAAAPRGRKPRMAAPAMPVAPAPVAVQEPAMTTEVPAYEAPATGSMPWETEVVGETAPMAMKKTRAPRAPKMAMATPAPAMPAAPAMQQYQAPAPVQQAAPIAQTGAISLAGQSIVFTGALQVNRMVAATMASKAGAMVSSALSAKTNLLVCGANAGEKMAKAQSMGIRTITEAEFVAACRH